METEQGHWAAEMSGRKPKPQPRSARSVQPKQRMVSRIQQPVGRLDVSGWKSQRQAEVQTRRQEQESQSRESLWVPLLQRVRMRIQRWEQQARWRMRQWQMAPSLQLAQAPLVELPLLQRPHQHSHSPTLVLAPRTWPAWK
jgi:hypothetical protein